MLNLIRNTYRLYFTKGIDLQNWYFKQCEKTAGNPEVYKIIRPENGFISPEIVQLILNTLNYQIYLFQLFYLFQLQKFHLHP